MRFCYHGGDTVVVEQGDKIQMDACVVKTLRPCVKSAVIVFNYKDKLILTGLIPL